MTDRARKLLERAVEWIEAQQEPRMIGANVISKEIRAYLSEPEVKREPMSYDEAEAGFYSTFLGCTVFDHFMAGVLFTEKHHGIGGGDE